MAQHDCGAPAQTLRGASAVINHCGAISLGTPGAIVLYKCGGLASNHCGASTYLTRYVTPFAF
jgi:hypothetical protein